VNLPICCDSREPADSSIFLVLCFELAALFFLIIGFVIFSKKIIFCNYIFMNYIKTEQSYTCSDVCYIIFSNNTERTNTNKHSSECLLQINFYFSSLFPLFIASIGSISFSVVAAILLAGFLFQVQTSLSLLEHSLIPLLFEATVVCKSSL
jgi:hypothetical protein